jgi:hypothetical protein
MADEDDEAVDVWAVQKRTILDTTAAVSMWRD